MQSNGMIIGKYKIKDNFAFIKFKDAGHMVPMN